MKKRRRQHPLDGKIKAAALEVINAAAGSYFFKASLIKRALSNRHVHNALEHAGRQTALAILDIPHLVEDRARLVVDAILKSHDPRFPRIRLYESYKVNGETEYSLAELAQHDARSASQGQQAHARS